MWRAVVLVALCSSVAQAGTKVKGDSCLLNQECDRSLGLECTFQHECDCKAYTVWIDGKCQKEANRGKDFLEPCSAASECKSPMTCTNKRCMCREGQDWSVYECVDEKTKKRPLEPCTLPSDCLRNLWCDSFASTCQCMNFTQWSEEQKACVTEYNKKCYSKSICKYPLECRNEVCSCPSSAKWTGTTCSIETHQKKLNDPCMMVNECSSNLECDSATKKCTCTAKSLWNDELQLCIKDYNEQCETTFMCKYPTECKNGICACPILSKWTGSTCSYAILIAVVVVCLLAIVAAVSFIIYRNMSNRRRRNAAKSTGMPMS